MRCLCSLLLCLFLLNEGSCMLVTIYRCVSTKSVEAYLSHCLLFCVVSVCLLMSFKSIWHNFSKCSVNDGVLITEHGLLQSSEMQVYFSLTIWWNGLKLRLRNSPYLNEHQKSLYMRSNKKAVFKNNYSFNFRWICRQKNLIAHLVFSDSQIF